MPLSVLGTLAAGQSSNLAGAPRGNVQIRPVFRQAFLHLVENQHNAADKPIGRRFSGADVDQFDR